MKQKVAVALFIIVACVCGGWFIGWRGYGRPAAAAQPRDLLRQGWDGFRVGNYWQAERCFNAILSTAPKKDDVYVQALFGLGHTFGQRQPEADPVRAEATFQRLAEDYPQHQLAGWSLLASARLKALVPVGETPDREAVLKAYQDVIDRHPQHPAADEAFMQQQAFRLGYADTAEDLSAIRTRVERFLADNPDSKASAIACNIAAMCATGLGDGPGSVALRIESLRAAANDRNPAFPPPNNAIDHWTLATVAEFEAGDLKAARAYYQQLIAEQPTDMRRYLAQLALKRLDALEENLRQEAAKLRAEGGAQ